MASPFSVFRKNQKYWMAGLVVMAMVAFVFMPQSMMNSFNRSRGFDQPVVRTTKFGNLTGGQLQTLKYNRLVFNEFLQILANFLAPNKQSPNPAVRVSQIIGGADDDAVFSKWLFAREAEAMGISVDEKALSAFLEVLTNQSLGRDGLLGILKNVRGGVSEVQFLSILREEVLALRYRELFHQLQDNDLWIGGTATPGERWTTFRRMNEAATIEVVLLSPKDFVKQVAAPDPSGETLKQFFEEHKQEYASPYLPNPGFHVPRRVNLQYLQADEEKFRAAVTEAEITRAIRAGSENLCPRHGRV